MDSVQTRLPNIKLSNYGFARIFINITQSLFVFSKMTSPAVAQFLDNRLSIVDILISVWDVTGVNKQKKVEGLFLFFLFEMRNEENS